MSKFDIKKYLHENRITINNGFDIHEYVKGTVMEDVVNDVINGVHGPKMKTELRRISSAEQIHEWANVNFPDVVNPINETSSVVKSLRKLGWAGDNWKPQDYKTQIRNLSDTDLKAWHKSPKGIPNTPLSFQQKLVKLEMERRGLLGEKVTVSKTELEAMVQEMVDKKMNEAKMSKEDAYDAAVKMGVDFNKDFHAQSFGNELADLAKKAGYRKPKSANGSTGRYFFYHLQKLKK